MVARGIYGFTRPFEHQNTTPRYYPINLDVFKDSITELMTAYLTIKMSEHDKFSTANITSEVEYIVPLVRDACCTALYARLNPISIHNKDLELPLPLADAIQNFGPFNPSGIPENYYCLPVFPENTQNEARAAVGWCRTDYDATILIMKELGIPFKSVDDTSVKTGTAWWCYRLKKIGNSFDFVCLYPPINYSDHSAILASMFIAMNTAGTEARNLTAIVEGDQEWPTRFRDLPIDYKLRVFSALCHDSSDKLNDYSSDTCYFNVLISHNCVSDLCILFVIFVILYALSTMTYVTDLCG